MESKAGRSRPVGGEDEAVSAQGRAALDESLWTQVVSVKREEGKLTRAKWVFVNGLRNGLPTEM